MIAKVQSEQRRPLYAGRGIDQHKIEFIDVPHILDKIAKGPGMPEFERSSFLVTETGLTRRHDLQPPLRVGTGIQRDLAMAHFPGFAKLRNRKIRPYVTAQDVLNRFARAGI